MVFPICSPYETRCREVLPHPPTLSLQDTAGSHSLGSMEASQGGMSGHQVPLDQEEGVKQGIWHLVPTPAPLSTICITLTSALSSPASSFPI